MTTQNPSRKTRKPSRKTHEAPSVAQCTCWIIEGEDNDPSTSCPEHGWMCEEDR